MQALPDYAELHCVSNFTFLRGASTADELIERGGFGSPTIVVDGDDLYFGNDRLPLVREALKAAP